MEEESLSENLQYENDLQLAAELGKSLLERNELLEKQLEEMTEYQYQQEDEINELNKEIEKLKSVSESRLKLYEEVDRHSTELEKESIKLKEERSKYLEKISFQTERIAGLEKHCEELQHSLDKFREEAEKRKQEDYEKKDRKKIYKHRTASVPSLRRKPLPDSGFAPPPTLDEVRDSAIVIALKTTVKNLKIDLCYEYKRNSKLEKDLSELIKESDQLKKEIEQLKIEPKKHHTTLMKISEDDEDIEFDDNNFQLESFSNNDQSLYGELKGAMTLPCYKDACVQTTNFVTMRNTNRPKSLQIQSPDYKTLFREIEDSINRSLNNK